MEDYKVLRKEFYNDYLEGISMFSGDKVLILGEQTVVFENGKEVEQYIYNIMGYRCMNGKPFVATKGNIVLI